MFQSSPIVKKIFWINVLLFVMTLIGQNLLGIPVMNYLALFPMDNPNFSFYQFITSLFMHGNLGHLFFNMLALVSFGPDVENQLGERKFLLFYMVMGIFASITQMLFVKGALIGASGAVFGILVYFTMYNPKARLSLFLLPIYIEARKILAFILFIEVILAIVGGDNVGHMAHLGGALTGFVLYKLDKKFQFNI